MAKERICNGKGHVMNPGVERCQVCKQPAVKLEESAPVEPTPESSEEKTEDNPTEEKLSEDESVDEPTKEESESAGLAEPSK